MLSIGLLYSWARPWSQASRRSQTGAGASGKGALGPVWLFGRWQAGRKCARDGARNGMALSTRGAKGREGEAGDSAAATASSRCVFVCVRACVRAWWAVGGLFAVGGPSVFGFGCGGCCASRVT